MIPTHTLLGLLRNPHGHSDDELRAARLQAAEMIEAAEVQTEQQYQAEFESWVSTLPSAEDFDLSRRKFGRFAEYTNATTYCMFDAWKAARTHWRRSTL